MIQLRGVELQRLGLRSFHCRFGHYSASCISISGAKVFVTEGQVLSTLL